MIRLNDIKQKIENNQITFYKVNLPVNIINNGIQFSNINDFVNFLSNQNITVVFGCEYFDNADEYLITNDIMEETLGKYYALEIQNIIIEDIEEHNNKVLKYDFNIPIAIIISCLYKGEYCFVYIENNDNETLLPEPTEKLQEIINKNGLAIRKKEEQQEEILEKLRCELKLKIKNDRNFLLCSNKRLRENYIKDLLKNKLDNQFEPLKNYWLANTQRGIYQGAIDFIELIWREN